MRALKPLCVFILITSLGCNESGSGKPAAGKPSSSNAAPADVSNASSSATMGKKSEAYWNKCIDVNKQFVTDKGDVWFKEFRPKEVGTTCRDAAKRLRDIDTTRVAPEVIDHVNRVIRGFEQMGAIAETKGKESLWRDTAAQGDCVVQTVAERQFKAIRVADFAVLPALQFFISLSANDLWTQSPCTAAAIAFVIKVTRRMNPGAVADGGSLAMGIGASEQGGKATREGQAETIGIANKLMESEEQVIRHVRKTYGIELKPW